MDRDEKWKNKEACHPDALYDMGSASNDMVGLIVTRSVPVTRVALLRRWWWLESG